MTAELTYFNMSGLGEPVRVMLSFGNIPFKDIRLSKEQWVNVKPETKFGMVPRLRIDDIELFQSRSICRYLATKIGLRSSDPKEAALSDMWVDAFDDVRTAIVNWYYQKDSDSRTENLEKVKNEVVPKALAMFENSLKTEESNYFVNNKLSWADVMFYGYFSYIADLLLQPGEEILSNYSRLLNIYKEIRSSAGIQNWLKNRPESPPDMRALFV